MVQFDELAKLASWVMRATWKKVWKADGTSEEWPDGRRPEEYRCVLVEPAAALRLLEPPMLLCDWDTANALMKGFRKAGYRVQD